MANAVQLNFELSSLLNPLSSLASTAVNIIARQIRDAGSDVHTESDLAQVLGRLIVDGTYDHKFMTVVNQPRKDLLLRITDIVISSGAGPTVQHALLNDHFRNSLIQLSLLTFVHSIDSLSAVLAPALAATAATFGLKDAHFDQRRLSESLRACRAQTNEFPWERDLQAVEFAMGLADSNIYQLNDLRILPTRIVQGLLQALFEAQRFPDERFVLIEASRGASTMVVWAHYVLGLTVRIEVLGNEYLFGSGRETVLIRFNRDLHDETLDSVKIFTSPGMTDTIFEIKPGIEQADELNPTLYKRLEGFGTYALSARFGKADVTQKLALRVYAECIRQSRRCRSRPCDDDTVEQIKKTVMIFFGGVSWELDDDEAVQLVNDPALILSAPWRIEDFPPEAEILGIVKSQYFARFDSNYRVDTRTGKVWAEESLFRRMSALTSLIMAFSWVVNVDRCGGVFLCKGAMETISWDSVDPWNAWMTIVTAMCGPDLPVPPSKDDWRQSTSAVSHNGWTATLGILDGSPDRNIDPTAIDHRIKIREGMLSRRGVHRSFVMDAFPTQFKGNAEWYRQERGENERIERKMWRCLAEPGQTLRLERRMFGSLHPPKIADHQEAFAVALFLQGGISDVGQEPQIQRRFGPRRLQYLCWRALLIGNCSHSVTDARVVLPPKTSAFVEWRLPAATAGVHLFMTWACQPARFCLLNSLINLEDDGWAKNQCVLLRGSGCCLECTILAAKELGNNVVAVVLL